ncbi:ABC transporter substrate-binding protein [Conexibacter sp. CPCC 206217]|uniref:ABC transporter substrate-binding protein n=1 Tax=Conexibacter sp. CPCC 206217 TaxID=3064574 RepID=UPI002717D115|nr:ABC transporter substrate-binding protein [Conexibacter sp. CPCC 206217]MDO8213128.1 ABC transporter substrate-binding protein [Conexibacter sp. CPCC 206217]
MNVPLAAVAIRARRASVVGTALIAAAALAAGCGSDGGTGTSASTSTSGSAAAGGPPVTKPADWGPAPPGGWITDFVRYVHGGSRDAVRGKANPDLAPVVIGYSSNDSGGSVTPVGAEATAGVEAAVKWINAYAGGINGHPLELKKCEILNAEEEGLQCGQKFLNDPAVKMITYGALAVGAQTINNIVKGEKVTIMGFSADAANATAKNVFSLFTAGGFAHYPIGNWAKEQLGAKACAVSTPDAPGSTLDANGIKIGCEAAGLATKAVAYNPTSQDLTAALTAAGSASGDTVTIAWPTTAAQCIATAKGLSALNVDPRKVIWSPSCINPEAKSQYPGGTYPDYYVMNAQSGDALINSPTGQAYFKALKQVGQEKMYNDPWWSGMWGQMLTIGQFLNEIGADKISNETILDHLKTWRGPLVLGAFQTECGKYPFYPGSCADGNWYFQPLGDGLYRRISGFVQPAPALVDALKDLPLGSSQPTSWPFK